MTTAAIVRKRVPTPTVGAGIQLHAGDHTGQGTAAAAMRKTYAL